jgi:hypothetical protein
LTNRLLNTLTRPLRAAAGEIAEPAEIEAAHVRLHAARLDLDHRVEQRMTVELTSLEARGAVTF